MSLFSPFFRSFLEPLLVVGTPANEAPVASFTTAQTAGTLEIAFTDTSTDSDGTITAWDWDYGDGSAHGTTQNPSHTYATAGNKTVVLTVTDDRGGTHAAQATVTVRAVIAPAVLTALTGSTTDASSFPTASVTPTANVPVVLDVAASAAGTAAPTVTGAGLTWVQERTVTLDAGLRRLTRFRACGASPSAGALTIDFAGVTQASILWCITSLPGADASGTNGSGACRQSTDNTVATNTTITGTLATLENANNVHLAAVMTTANAAITESGSFAELGDDGRNANTMRLEVEWRRGVTTCSPTFASTNAVIISTEIKAA